MNLRRSLSTLLLALLLVPGAALAQARRSSSSARSSPTTATPPLRIGAYVGFESGDWDGLALRVDGEIPFRRLAPNVTLSGVGSVGFSHLTLSQSTPIGSTDSTVNRFDVVPAARFTFEANPQLSLYGDVGLGLYYARLSVSFPPGTLPDTSDTDFGVKMRFGVGGFFAVSPTLDVGAEAALQPHFGDYDDTTFTIMAAARFRI